MSENSFLRNEALMRGDNNSVKKQNTDVLGENCGTRFRRCAIIKSNNNWLHYFLSINPICKHLHNDTIKKNLKMPTAY